MWLTRSLGHCVAVMLCRSVSLLTRLSATQTQEKGRRTRDIKRGRNLRKGNQPLGLLYIEFSYLCKGCIIKGTKLLLAYKEYILEFIIESSRSELFIHAYEFGRVAQLVARFPCKEEVSGSIPDSSIFCLSV